MLLSSVATQAEWFAALVGENGKSDLRIQQSVLLLELAD